MSVKDCKTEPYAPPIARGISGGKWVTISPRRGPIKKWDYARCWAISKRRRNRRANSALTGGRIAATYCLVASLRGTDNYALHTRGCNKVLSHGFRPGP